MAWKNPFKFDAPAPIVPEVPEDWYMWYQGQQPEAPAPVEKETITYPYGASSYSSYALMGQPFTWEVAPGKIGPAPVEKETIPYKASSYSSYASRGQPVMWGANRGDIMSAKTASLYDQTKYAYLGYKGATTSGQVFPGMRVPGELKRAPKQATFPGMVVPDPNARGYLNQLPSRTFPGMVVPDRTTQWKKTTDYSSGVARTTWTKTPGIDNFDKLTNIREWLRTQPTFPGMVIPDYNARDTTEETGSDLPPQPDYSGYGGYYGYGGGGGSYTKEKPSWYMQLTNWKI
jgi:hypothetical protein